MDLTGETYVSISREWGYSEDSLRRHKANHIAGDVGDIKAIMEQARIEALEEARQKEMEAIKEEIAAEARETIASRLELCTDHFGQLRVLRERAAFALETAEGAEDVKVALLAIKELRELVRLWGELEGKLQSQPTVNVLISPQWIQLKTTILTVLQPYPEAREALIDALQ